MSKAIQIRTLDDIEALLVWIEEEAQKPNLRFYRFVLQRLFDGGEFSAIHVDTLIKLISKNKLWSDQLNQETNTAPEVLRDRFSRRIRWLNKLVWNADDSPYATTLAIVYDRASSKYQMVSDSERVQIARVGRPPRRQTEVSVDFHTDDLLQGMPCLSADSELEFSIRSSISGYIHIFHRDGDGCIDKLFPEHGSELFLRIDRGKDLYFPDAISDLCKLKCWKIGAPDVETPVQQQLLVVVTARNVDVAVEDIIEEFGGVRARPINIQHMQVDDLTERQKLSTLAEYQLNR
ncbi:hypothetical protein PDESU_03620 [Pontiella desulfatans]|uniref:Uncharacterized protein n=1 Tax=Pontiella desulfatans TaxID=2750659 RepID=A0A6C2U4Y0_PONDE|nr:DUF4384 domain-containing protein [Pontiella desulfatans]VGO15040.1 hypothetical protein PDESU_03620 [Pontiella desulfatans]